uniref:Extensin domain-containing protein n=1 Tax=Salix viminalis TaxID=40686 RepID=A0A6N2K1W8_SALVM
MGTWGRPGYWPMQLVYAVAFCLIATTVVAYKPYTDASHPPLHHPYEHPSTKLPLIPHHYKPQLPKYVKSHHTITTHLCLHRNI